MNDLLKTWYEELLKNHERLTEALAINNLKDTEQKLKENAKRLEVLKHLLDLRNL